MTDRLETNRLLIRPLQWADLDFIAEMMAHPDVMRYYPRRLSLEESEAWVRRQQQRYARGEPGFWLVTRKATGQPIGQAGLVLQTIEEAEETGLAYIFHRPFWGRGFATEAGRAWLEHAFQVLKKKRVVCTIRPENTPSLAVAERLGMQLERRVTYARFEHLMYVARPDAIVGSSRSP